MKNGVGLQPLRRGRMPRIPKLAPKREEETLQVVFRMPKELLRRVVSIGRATEVTKTDVLLHLVRWGVDSYEAEHGAPPLVDDAELLEKRPAKTKVRR
jgi:hypothetical protein